MHFTSVFNIKLTRMLNFIYHIIFEDFASFIEYE